MLVIAFVCARTLNALHAATDVVHEFRYASIGTEGTVGVPCATCHVGSYREEPGAAHR